MPHAVLAPTIYTLVVRHLVLYLVEHVRIPVIAVISILLVVPVVHIAAVIVHTLVPPVIRLILVPKRSVAVPGIITAMAHVTHVPVRHGPMKAMIWRMFITIQR